MNLNGKPLRGAGFNTATLYFTSLELDLEKIKMFK